jgi:YHS domain-containing protein
MRQSVTKTEFMNIIARFLQTALWVAVVIMLLSSPARAEEPALALDGFDPVLLAEGMEVRGKASAQATHGHYRYHFANRENQQKFEAAPDKHGIQFDGFCMKMGPLSGRGSPERWFVSEGRIYLFASESCRHQFKMEPQAYPDRADLPPSGNVVSQRRGRELIWLALKGFGGVDKVDALTNAQWETVTIFEQGGKKTEMRQTATVMMPNQLRLDYSYGNFRETHALTNGQLLEISAKNEVTSLPADVYAFVRRRLYREPLALLRVRNEPGFVAFAGGTGKVDDQPVEWLNVGYAGATTRLGIELETGRILAVVYRGRAPSKLGEICRSYSDFKAMEGGLILPQHWEVTYEGLPPADGPKPASRSVLINVPLAAR